MSTPNEFDAYGQALNLRVTAQAPVGTTVVYAAEDQWRAMCWLIECFRRSVVENDARTLPYKKLVIETVEWVADRRIPPGELYCAKRRVRPGEWFADFLKTDAVLLRIHNLEVFK